MINKYVIITNALILMSINFYFLLYIHFLKWVGGCFSFYSFFIFFIVYINVTVHIRLRHRGLRFRFKAFGKKKKKCQNFFR